MDYVWGLDFGANKSGNTAIAISNGSAIEFHQSKAKESADDWLATMVTRFPPEIIAIDAPLSLPAGWCGGTGDLFYRECDQKLKAMSPLFLGGLTARAVKFSRRLRHRGVEVIESYPKGFVNHLLDGQYPEPEGDLNPVLSMLPGNIKLRLTSQPSNEHQMDALICLVVAYRFSQRQTIRFGKYGEGIIHV
ncbi:MAG: DUF429 domain-containing protein [Saprospirales bacterium]|nr:MAG: DUF429 domain-containing protein [Saprospirales bacterium]